MLVAARYRELERLMAIEQAKELGFEDLETARDLLAPPDLTQAREYVSSRAVWCPPAWFLLILSTCCWWCFARRMLEELIDVLKAKGVPNVVPELLPKGMKWRDVLAFVQKYPRTHLPISNDHVRLTDRKLILSLLRVQSTPTSSAWASWPLMPLRPWCVKLYLH